MNRRLAPFVALGITVAIAVCITRFGFSFECFGPLLIVTALLMRLGSWVHQARQAGPCVVALRPRPDRKTWLLHVPLAIVGLPLIALALIAGSPLLWPFIAAHFALVSWTLAGYLTGIQVRAHGLLKVQGLMTWDKVESFDWIDGPAPKLQLTARTALPPPRDRASSTIPVPADTQEFLDTWLRWRLSPDAEIWPQPALMIR